MNAYLSTIFLPGDPAVAENPLPYFRDQTKNRAVKFEATTPPEYLDGLGCDLSFRVLPYKMQDNYGRGRELCALKAAVLENDIMVAKFLPDFGGRLYSLYNKKDKRELLFCNPVLQLANIAIRNAWISGGIEWNIGRTGHTYHTCEPVFFQKCEDENGEMFLRMFEYDRCEGLCYSIEFRLPEKSEALYASVKITNTRDEAVPMYWWTNIAVRETADMRILAGTDKMLFFGPQGLAYGKMPNIHIAQNQDASFPSVFGHANEYFFQEPEEDCPWEAAIYPMEDWFFAEYSTPELKYRKMFCWGTHQGGRVWRDFLSEPGKGDYVEIQAGLGRTQVHGLVMPGGATWGFTQAFTSVDADAKKLCSLEYGEAIKQAKNLFSRKIPEFAAEKQGRAQFICYGSGWGALEAKRRRLCGEKSLPLNFPEASIESEQLPWLNLLTTGSLPDNTASFMINIPGSGWLERVEKAAENGEREALVHLGIMRYENGLEKEAVDAWEKSLPHSLAYRNLSLVEAKNGNAKKAAELMEEATKLNKSEAYVAEYAELLIKTENYEKCWELLSSLAESAPDRVWINRAKCAWHTKRLGELELMFLRNYSSIREGETTLTDLWFSWAKETGQENQTAPPKHIDFRMS